MVVGARSMCCRRAQKSSKEQSVVTDVTRHRQVADATGPRLVTISGGITYIAWHVHCITCQHMRTGGICIPTRRVPRRSPVPTVWVGTWAAGAPRRPRGRGQLVWARSCDMSAPTQSCGQFSPLFLRPAHSILYLNVPSLVILWSRICLKLDLVVALLPVGGGDHVPVE